MPRGRFVAGVVCGVSLAFVAAACGSGGSTSSNTTASSSGTSASASGTSASGSSGTSGSEPTTTAPASDYVTGGTMTQLIPSDPGNLDPLTTVTSVTRDLDFYAYDPLINLKANGSFTSGLATKWKESGNTYTFTLKDGLTCSDGSKFTAATAAANINYLGNPKNKSPLLDLFVPPDAKATARGSMLTIKLPSPFPFFLNELTQIGLVCAKGLANPKLLAEKTDGTGAYTLSSAVPGSQYTFTLRKGYSWGPGGATANAAGIPQTLDVKVVADATTEANELLEGEANLATVQGLPSKPLIAAHLHSESGAIPLGELWFNQTAGRATADQKVRQALTADLDLSQLGQVIGQGLGTAATGMVTVTPEACAANTVSGSLPAHSQSAAEKLLDEAGWKVGTGGIRSKGGKQLKLTLIYATDTGGDPGSAFELAAQELKKIGVDVTLQGETTTALESVIFGSGNWDIVNVPLGINTPSEAVPFVSGTVAPNGENFSHIDNTAYTSLVAKATAMSGTKGCSDWELAEKKLFRAADVVPFENASEPTWAKNASFQQVTGLIPPTSLRLLKG